MFFSVILKTFAYHVLMANKNWILKYMFNKLEIAQAH